MFDLIPTKHNLNYAFLFYSYSSQIASANSAYIYIFTVSILCKMPSTVHLQFKIGDLIQEVLDDWSDEMYRIKIESF